MSVKLTINFIFVIIYADEKIAFIVNPISGISHKEVILLYLKSVFTAENGYDALFIRRNALGMLMLRH